MLDHLQVQIDVPDLAACWRAGDLPALAEAAGQVAQLIRRVERPLRQALAADDLLALFDDVEMPLILVLAEMEWRGIALDTPHLQALSVSTGERDPRPGGRDSYAGRRRIHD